MTFEEMEKSLIVLQDNQVVQGHLLHRVELVQERNAVAIGRIEEAVAKLADGFILLQGAMKGLAQTVERNTERIGKLEDVSALLDAALKRLAETVDRFIRGLERNGHGGSSKKGRRQ